MILQFNSNQFYRSFNLRKNLFIISGRRANAKLLTIEIDVNPGDKWYENRLDSVSSMQVVIGFSYWCIPA